MNYGLVAYPEPPFPGYEELRNNWTVGLALQIPLFTGFRITGDVEYAQADLAEARARLKQAEELSRLDSRQIQEQLETAEAALRASVGVVEQARKARGIAEIRYQEGISTQLELSDAQLLLDQAEANRARAARDLQVARVRAALIDHLPAGAGGGAGGGFAGAAAAGPQAQ
jgi:outer membrane protein TolC